MLIRCQMFSLPVWESVRWCLASAKHGQCTMICVAVFLACPYWHADVLYLETLALLRKAASPMQPVQIWVIRKLSVLCNLLYFFRIFWLGCPMPMRFQLGGLAVHLFCHLLCICCYSAFCPWSLVFLLQSAAYQVCFFPNMELLLVLPCHSQFLIVMHALWTTSFMPDFLCLY